MGADFSTHSTARIVNVIGRELVIGRERSRLTKDIGVGAKFLAEIVAGRDPRIPPDVPRAAIGVTVAEFLDTY